MPPRSTSPEQPPELVQLTARHQNDLPQATDNRRHRLGDRQLRQRSAVPFGRAHGAIVLELGGAELDLSQVETFSGSASVHARAVEQGPCHSEAAVVAERFVLVDLRAALNAMRLVRIEPRGVLLGLVFGMVHGLTSGHLDD